MKIRFIMCVMLFLTQIVDAQNKITGKITSEGNLPLVGATVFVPDMNKGTVSDNNGQFELTNLPSGNMKVQISYIGYSNRIETVNLRGNEVELNVSLKQTVIEAEEIVVSGGYNSTQHENAVKIDVLKVNQHAKVTSNFTEMLTQVPGVDMISKGGGISKPVIRGLSMNDILILNNGVRFENYQYSSHHPLGIDEFGIDNIEIIKGPASLLYGSDAIGGVINFIKEKLAPLGSIVGDYNVQLFSNTQGLTNNLGIKGSSQHLFGGIRIGQKTNADFLQGGGDYVPNSRFNEMSLKANIGFTDKIGTFKLYYDYNNQKLGLVEEEAIEVIVERGRKNSIFYQELNTHLLSSQNKLYLGKYKLDVNAAFQNTELTHFAEVGVTEIQMKLTTLTYEAKFHLPSSASSEYIVGFQGLNQQNINLNDRETKLLPDATTNNYSGFLLLQRTFFDKLKLQTGVRYDNKIISSQSIGLSTDEDYRPALEKPFGSFSGSFGATYHLSDDLLFRANYAIAYRTPNLAELTSNGQHELRYEIGNQQLVPENAYEVDVSLHYHKENFTFDLAVFNNRIDNYVFISPTGETRSGDIPVFKYKQANSVLYGGEAGLHIHPKMIKWLHIESAYASVVGKQDNGDYLPFVPAHKFRFELMVELEKVLFLHNAFASAKTFTAFDQNNAAQDETTTLGYTLVDLNLGGNIKIVNGLFSIGLSVSNLFDTKYIDHLSTLKEVNLYNPGRNIALSLKIPFGRK